MKKIIILSVVCFWSLSSLAANTFNKVMYWADSNAITLSENDVTIINEVFIRWTVADTPPTQAQLDAIPDATVDTWVQDGRKTRPLEMVFMARYSELQGYMGTNLTASVPFALGDSMSIEQALHSFIKNEATASQADEINSLATSLMFLWNAISSVDNEAMYTPYFGQ